jgi:hypothetical protein
MDKDLEKYYEAQLSMFTTSAWKDYIEDVTAMLEAADHVSGITPDELGFKQGEVSMMKWIIGREADVHEAYKGLKTDADL